MKRILLIAMLLPGCASTMQPGQCVELSDGSGLYGKYEGFYNWMHYVRLDTGELTSISESDFFRIDCKSKKLDKSKAERAGSLYKQFTGYLWEEGQLDFELERMGL